MIFFYGLFFDDIPISVKLRIYKKLEMFQLELFYEDVVSLYIGPPTTNKNDQKMNQ